MDELLRMLGMVQQQGPQYDANGIELPPPPGAVAPPSPDIGLMQHYGQMMGGQGQGQQPPQMDPNMMSMLLKMMGQGNMQ